MSDKKEQRHHREWDFHFEYSRSPLLADRADDARGGAGVTAPRTLHLLQDRSRYHRTAGRAAAGGSP